MVGSNHRAGPPLAIVAMGGHAFIRGDEKGTIQDHERNAEYIAGQLMHLVEGDYRLVNVAGESILLVCGDDGNVRAFNNVCRHRGA